METSNNFSIDSFISSGNELFYQGRYREALQYYNQGLRRETDNGALLISKGNVLLALGKRDDAYGCYFSALVNAELLELLDHFIEGAYHYSAQDTDRLYDLLTYQYHLPFSKAGLDLLIKRINADAMDAQRLKTWKAFERKVEQKKLASTEEIIIYFLQQFGENYFLHFFSLQCYLWKFKDKTFTKNELIALIQHQKRMMELKRFERRLKAGFRKKGKSLDQMTGVEFEQYLATLFAILGHQVTKTPPVGDQGADLILKRFGEITVVQAKRWKQPVGPTAIQQVFTAKQLFDAQNVLVVTTSKFTKQAKEMAEKLGVELWNRQRLLEKIHHY